MQPKDHTSEFCVAYFSHTYTTIAHLQTAQAGQQGLRLLAAEAGASFGLAAELRISFRGQVRVEAVKLRGEIGRQTETLGCDLTWYCV